MEKTIRMEISPNGQELVIRIPVRLVGQFYGDAGATKQQILYGLFTPRERDVLGEMFKGKSHKEAGVALNVSERTVKFHAAEIYRKLGVTSRVDMLKLFSLSELNSLKETNDDTEQAGRLLSLQGQTRSGNCRTAASGRN